LKIEGGIKPPFFSSKDCILIFYKKYDIIYIES
jgi:hypothetical protein